MARRRNTQNTQDWREEHEDLISWLDAQDDDSHDFIFSMKEALARWGALTPKQTAAIEKWRTRSIEREQTREQETDRFGVRPALPEGHRAIEGLVISTKWKDTRYGPAYKMLILEDDGNKVFGTVPANLPHSAEIVNERIFLVATVTRSDRDEHFGFFSRPTGAELLR